jgi:hypothetical protein
MIQRDEMTPGFVLNLRDLIEELEVKGLRVRKVIIGAVGAVDVTHFQNVRIAFPYPNICCRSTLETHNQICCTSAEKKLLGT